MDEALFRAVNKGLSGPAMDWLMVTITTPENWYAPIAALAAGMVIIDRRRGLAAVFVAVLVVAIGDSLSHYALKPLFSRVRPCNALEGVNLLVGCTQSFSFPSNHAVNSFAVAGAIGGLFRPLLFALAPIGLLVCLSRVAVGVHYPFDVIAGGLLGFGLGWGGSTLANRWIFAPSRESDGE
jgi:undecaprenyl-diphosphatase